MPRLVAAVRPRRPRVPYQVWFALMWASAIMGIIAVTGHYLGWF
jgi:hypothetical protein